MNRHTQLDDTPDESADPGVFQFELDFGGTLRCIPMSVRMKLDQCGIKLSLKQWNRIPPSGRRELIERPCDTPAETRAYQQYLISQIRPTRGRRWTMRRLTLRDSGPTLQLFRHASAIGRAALGLFRPRRSNGPH